MPAQHIRLRIPRLVWRTRRIRKTAEDVVDLNRVGGEAEFTYLNEQSLAFVNFRMKVCFHFRSVRGCFTWSSRFFRRRVFWCDRIQFGKNCLGTDHANNFCADHAVEEKNQHGNGLNPVDGSQVGIVIHIHFENFCVAVAGFSDFIQYRLDQLARFAPTRQEAHQDWLRGTQDLGFELRLINFLD